MRGATAPRAGTRVPSCSSRSVPPVSRSTRSKRRSVSAASAAVTGECLEFTLATNQEAGVWGGLTEEERRRLRKGWTAQPSPT